MKYLVIEGRAPQDGSPAKRALILCPEWMSSTLVCAGIVGRVVELTDGNIVEEGVLPGSEEAVLEEIREDAAADLESQQEFEEPPAVDMPQAPNTDPHATDDAYRQGMQKVRTRLAELLLPFGMPADAKVSNWLKEQLEELAQLRATPAPIPEDGFNSDKNVQELRRLCIANGYNPVEMGPLLPWLEELMQFRAFHRETLTKLQAAEAALDAWRDAAGSAGLVQECDVTTGQIKRLYMPEDLGSNTEAQRLRNDNAELKERVSDLMDEVQEQSDKNGQLRYNLDKIRKLAKNALK
jgi:hypothetical protein